MTRNGSRMGGVPSLLRGALSRICPNCGAGRGVRCLTFMTYGGVRLYPKGTRVNPHPERVHPST